MKYLICSEELEPIYVAEIDGSEMLPKVGMTLEVENGEHYTVVRAVRVHPMFGELDRIFGLDGIRWFVMVQPTEKPEEALCTP